MKFLSVFGGLKPAQLRRLRHGYAAVTPKNRMVTRVTPKSLARVRERIHVFIQKIISNNKNTNFFTEQKNSRNRVTHVTTGILGVTIRVTDTFWRNYAPLLLTSYFFKKIGGVKRKKMGVR